MTSSNLPEELQALLREAAAAEAPELLARVRARALLRAEQLLEDALVDELLAAAARSRSPGNGATPAARNGSSPARAATPRTEEAGPAGDEGSVAWWTYCVIWGPDAEARPLGLEGLEPGSRVEVIHDGQLAALVSRVPLSEYDDERLRVHLEDLEWVERIARRHEDVLEAVLSAGTIVPLRLCTLYRTQDGVRQLLREHGAAFREGLGRVDGCLEWGVKLFCDPAAPKGEHVADEEDSASRGLAYLHRRQQERALAEEGREVRARCVEVVHQRIESLSRCSSLNPPQRPELHGRELTMLLNGAYLIERNRTLELQRAAESLQEEWAALGFTIELTGPWPPYNFVSGPDGVLS